MLRAPASMMTSGLGPMSAARCDSSLRRLLLKMALATTTQTAAPMFWANMMIAMAVGICFRGTRLWTAMYA